MEGKEQRKKERKKREGEKKEEKVGEDAREHTVGLWLAINYLC